MVQRSWLNVGCCGELEPDFAWAVCILAGAVSRMKMILMMCGHHSNVYPIPIIIFNTLNVECEIE